MFSAELDLEDFFKVTTITKAPPRFGPKVPSGTKAPVKPKPKPGKGMHLAVFICVLHLETLA